MNTNTKVGERNHRTASHYFWLGMYLSSQEGFTFSNCRIYRSLRSIMRISDSSKAVKAIAAGTKEEEEGAIIRGQQLSKVERNEVVALITMEIHNR